jgi:hypothetical protein
VLCLTVEENDFVNIGGIEVRNRGGRCGKAFFGINAVPGIPILRGALADREAMDHRSASSGLFDLVLLGEPDLVAALGTGRLPAKSPLALSGPGGRLCYAVDLPRCSPALLARLARLVPNHARSGELLVPLGSFLKPTVLVVPAADRQPAAILELSSLARETA